MQTSGVTGLLNSCFGIAAGVFVLCGLASPAYSQGRGSPLVGKPAPEFYIQGIYHEGYSLEKFKGHILVMQFGASW